MRLFLLEKQTLLALLRLAPVTSQMRLASTVTADVREATHTAGFTRLSATVLPLKAEALLARATLNAILLFERHYLLQTCQTRLQSLDTDRKGSQSSLLLSLGRLWPTRRDAFVMRLHA